MVPYQYPKQQVKDKLVVEKLNEIIRSKVEQEKMAQYVYDNSDDVVLKQFSKALIRANRLIVEDLYREAGYMLPQSQNTRDFLNKLLDENIENDIKDDIKKLLDMLELNE